MLQTREYHFHFSFNFGSGHDSYLVTLAGLGTGLGVFANGFWNYRKPRLIENTPRIAVRALLMGLVHVHGKATGRNLLSSPVTGTPCCYYKVHLQRFGSSVQQCRSLGPQHTNPSLVTRDGRSRPRNADRG